MTDPTTADVAARADFLRLASQLHSGDIAGTQAVLAGLASRPSGFAVTLLEAALREFLAALRAMAPDPAKVQRWLDDAALAALDQLRATP
ncbi:hypothetical protein [Mycobacterium sp. UM_Kg1]|uniref:hypothetical protein n=1 Tax=Mycobacterium sp. UM_Kg1 TaxID=1545691 RepID=UPI00061AF783|nr:hypothetical protein [Mycobacterium sp. UM_Kg1]